MGSQKTPVHVIFARGVSVDPLIPVRWEPIRPLSLILSHSSDLFTHFYSTFSFSQSFHIRIFFSLDVSLCSCKNISLGFVWGVCRQSLQKCQIFRPLLIFTSFYGQTLTSKSVHIYPFYPPTFCSLLPHSHCPLSFAFHPGKIIRTAESAAVCFLLRAATPWT